jgi:hypothetical protein
MMYWILLLMGAIVSLVAAVLVSGFMVPRAYRAARIATLSMPGDAMRTTWQALDAIGDWPLWTEQARTVSVAESAPPGRLLLRVHGDDGGVRSQLTLALSPRDGGVEVRASEEGTLSNPVVRLIRHYATGHAGLVTSVLTALGHETGATVDVRAA